MSRWIRFAEDGTSRSGKTRRWGVLSKDGDSILGQIEWYAPWRRYCFSPQSGNLVFEQDCLRDIAAFIETETRNHKTPRATA